MSRVVEALRPLGGQLVAVAWSGGADSTALLHGCIEALGAESVVALHVDHGIRIGSEADEAFCAAVAGAVGVGYGAASLELGPGASESVARRHR